MNLNNFYKDDPFAKNKKEVFGDAYDAHLNVQDEQKQKHQPAVDSRIQEGKNFVALIAYTIKYFVILGFKIVFWGATIISVIFLLSGFLMSNFT